GVGSRVGAGGGVGATDGRGVARRGVGVEPVEPVSGLPKPPCPPPLFPWGLPLKLRSSSWPRMTVTPDPAGVAAGPPVPDACGRSTEVPKYVASHCAVLLSRPPLLSITLVVAVVRPAPPSVALKPTIPSSFDQRPEPP